MRERIASMQLDALTAAVFQVKPWSTARKHTVNSHISQFARMLGCLSTADCPPERYNLADDAVFSLINTHKPHITAATHKIMRVNIQGVLHEGRRQQWIPSIDNLRTITPWRQGSLHGKRVHRGTGADRSHYALKPLPSELAAELDAYLTWCELPIAEDRDWHIIKRPISSKYVASHVARLAGYAVHIEDRPAEPLTLRKLADADFLKRFAWWWLKRRGKHTSGVKDILGVMLTIANHWPPEQRRRAGMSEAQMEAERLRDLLIVERIRKLFANLPPDEAVLDKDAQWLPLDELFSIGEHAHPLNKDRLAESPFAREVKRHIDNPARYLRPGASLRWLASHVGLSLMLRLWVHRPVRQRQWREMKIGEHLRPDANGGYVIRFKGKGLKVGRRHRQENKWEEHFPIRLLPALADWLHVWRPRIAAPDCPYVFVTKGGKPWSDNNLTNAISKLTWAFTQRRPGGPVATTPHMIRTIFRTEMCKAGMDVMTAARLLGDSIATVHKHYSHVDHRTPISQWTRDLAKAIQAGTD